MSLNKQVIIQHTDELGQVSRMKVTSLAVKIVRKKDGTRGPQLFLRGLTTGPWMKDGAWSKGISWRPIDLAEGWEPVDEAPEGEVEL